MSGYQFDLKKFVSDLGGPMACWRRLVDMGVPIQPRTVNKWLERGNIDVVYVVNLMAHRALNEGPVDINTYISPARGEVIRPRASGSASAPAEPLPSALRG